MPAKLKKKIQHFKKGSTLLLALLVLSSLAIITLSIAEVVRIEALLARSTDYTVVATYAAESSLEEGLWKLRKDPTTTVASLNGASFTLSNNASWTRLAVAVEPSLSIPALIMDAEYPIDLYDPESGLQANKESLVVSGCLTGQWLEVGYTEWTPSAAFTENFQKFRYPCTTGTSVTVNNITASKAYRMYLRALTANMYNISVTACTLDNGGGTCDMLGRIRLTATGSYLGAKRGLSMSMPRNPVVNGLYAYTIFSECQIIKDPTQANPSC